MEDKKYLLTICNGDVTNLGEEWTQSYISFQVTEKEKDYLIKIALEHGYEIALSILEETE